VKRREFIAGSMAAAWPLSARAQQSAARLRKIGLLQGLAASDPDWQRRLAAFRQGLADLGWVEGRNFVFEFRHADAKPERLSTLATELVKAEVDVIVTNAAQPVDAARAATRTIPIVMAAVGDALGGGYVASLARPGGNITGFTLVATDQSAKRLELIKEIAPFRAVLRCRGAVPAQVQSIRIGNAHVACFPPGRQGKRSVSGSVWFSRPRRCAGWPPRLPKSTPSWPESARRSVLARPRVR